MLFKFFMCQPTVACIWRDVLYGWDKHLPEKVVRFQIFAVHQQHHSHSTSEMMLEWKQTCLLQNLLGHACIVYTFSTSASLASKKKDQTRIQMGFSMCINNILYWNTATSVQKKMTLSICEIYCDSLTLLNNKDTFMSQSRVKNKNKRFCLCYIYH